MSKNKGFDYLLLDWDGCLADSLEMWMEVYRAALKSWGFEPTRQDVVKRVFGNWHGVRNIGIKDLDTFYEELSPLAERGMQQVELYSGVEQVLKTLNGMGKKIAIVTSSRRSVVEPAVKRLGLKGLVDCLLTSDDVENIKPDPEVVYKALEKLRAVKDRAVIVGDTDKDVGAGKNAGIATAIFYPSENERFYGLEDLEKLEADYLIRKFDELLEIVGN